MTRTVSRLWALLLPFTLVNAAMMALPAPSSSRLSRVAARVARGLIRAAGLALTLLLIGLLAELGTTLAARWGWPTLVGCAPAVVAAVAVWFGAARSAVRHRPNSHYPATGFFADHDRDVLLDLHALAALAFVVLGCTGAVTVPTTSARLGGWIGALVVLGFCTVATALYAGAPRRWLGKALHPVVTFVLVVALLGVLVGVGGPARFGALRTLSTSAALALVVVFAVVLLVLTATTRAGRRATASGLRPYAGGWSALVLLAAATGLAVTLCAAVERCVIGSTREASVLLVAAVLAALAVLILVGCALFAPFAIRRGVSPELALLHEKAADAQAAARAWWWATLRRERLPRWLAVGALVLWLVATANELCQWFGVRFLPAEPTTAWVGVAAVFAVLVGAGVARVDRWWSWPALGHPVVPESDLPSVIDEVAERAAEHLRDPQARVVLTGHGQGALVAAAAAGTLLSELSPVETERVGVVLAGSALQSGFVRAFPAVVSPDAVTNLHRDLEGRLRALCRGTDPYGGAVTTWRRQVFHGELLGLGLRTDGPAGPLEAADVSEHGALVLGGDHWLPDPQRAPVTGRRWRSGVSAHADYQADPEWDNAVAFAAGLISGRAIPNQVPLFGMPGLFKT